MESLEKIESRQPQNTEPKPEEKHLPTGIGGIELKKDIKTLPAVEIANEVSWVNNKMNLPFDLKIGKSSPLGMFLTPEPKEGEKTYNLEVSGSHTRSGILGRVIFSDKEGRLYRDIDLKGMGNILTFALDGIRVGPIMGFYDEVSYQSSNFSFFKGTPGVANQELIRRDLDFSEQFLKAGVRTHRVVALIDLKEIVDDEGNKISIDEAKDKGILSKEDEPVIEVRAYGTRSRLWDVINYLNHPGYDDNKERGKEQALKLLSDAKKLVAQELNADTNDFTFDEYFKWLINTTAINVARMHHNRWVSGYLTEHNLTLDGRIVDLDSIEKLSRGKESLPGGVFGEKSFNNDFEQVQNSLFNFISNVTKDGIINVISTSSSLATFRGAYENELSRLKARKK